MIRYYILMVIIKIHTRFQIAPSCRAGKRQKLCKDFYLLVL